MKQILEQKLAEKIAFDLEFKAYIKDTSIPLEQRWEDFKFAVDKGVFSNIESCGGHSEVLEKNISFSWYDDFGLDRYSTMLHTDAIERIEDDLEAALDPENEYCDLDDCLLKSQEEIDELKEEFLASGYSGFVYDW